MKEYTVIQIKGRKDLTYSEIYQTIHERVKFDSNFFMLENVRVKSKKLQAFEELNLERYFYIKKLEHLVNSKNYDPARDDRKVYSNMDSRWEWHHPTEHAPLSEDVFSKLVSFCDTLKGIDVATVILGFDEIQWDHTRAEKGTYGCRKANFTFDSCRNYFSNSVTVLWQWGDKSYTIQLACESRFKNLDVIKEIASHLGKVEGEITQIVPETEEERVLYEKEVLDAKTMFDEAIKGIADLKLKKYEKYGTAGTSKPINIQSHIKKVLCTDGWEKRKASIGEWATQVCKEKGERTIALSISPNHNGHDVQILAYYRNKLFRYGKHTNITIYDAHEDQIEIFFENVKIIRDYLYEVL